MMERAQRGVFFAHGLTDTEIVNLEERHGFRFPPDLRGFLQTALPVGSLFPDWRSLDDSTVRERLSWPEHGILFDVESNSFWLPEWGPRPVSIEDAKEIARHYIRQAPKLIPVYSHRMMPETPHLAGNPVLSVYQTDIIYYGFDLDDYFRHEFGLPKRKPWPSEIRPIAFWEVERWQELQ